MDFRNGFPIGYVSKSHGFKGHVKLNFFEEKYKSKVKKSGFLFLELSKKGVPFFIEEADSNGAIVKLEDVDSEEDARKLSALQIVSFDDDLVEGEGQLSGFDLYDQSEMKIGVITDVLDLKGNVLLEVKGESKEYYIPFHEDLVLGVDPEEKVIHLEIAEGLLDIE